MSDRGSSPAPFDMPDASRSFEERGGWLAKRLAEVFQLELFQAAGFVGNPGYESGGFKELQELAPAVSGSRGGYGWSQWTGPRRRAFEAWAAAHKLKPSSDEANYGFMVEELRRGFPTMLNRLRETKTIEEATFLVGRLYEAPGGTTETHLPGYTERLHYAKRALAGAVALTNRPIIPGSVDTAPTPQTQTPIPPAKDLQQALVAAGEDPGPVDGMWGPLSAAALRSYYRRG